MSRGFLIAFTGIDGSGKTTQAKLLVKALKQSSPLYVWSRWEPFLLRPIITLWKKNVKRNMINSDCGYHEIKSSKNKLLNNPVFRWLWLTFFFIDYGLQIFMKVRILLFRKRLVISDRISYDSIIDQAINLGNRQDFLLNNLNSFWMRILCPKPDIIIYIDCPEDIAFLRKNDAPNIDYLKERRALYLKLVDKYRWVKVDGTLSIIEVAPQIKDKVCSKLGISDVKSCDTRD